MATEKEYDDIIAPMLADVAKRCMELGMHMVARVEWEPNEAGVTGTSMGDPWSAGMLVADHAARCGGNFDRLAMILVRRCPEKCKESIVLAPFVRVAMKEVGK